MERQGALDQMEQTAMAAMREAAQQPVKEAVQARQMAIQEDQAAAAGEYTETARFLIYFWEAAAEAEAIPMRAHQSAEQEEMEAELCSSQQTRFLLLQLAQSPPTAQVEQTAETRRTRTVREEAVQAAV